MNIVRFFQCAAVAVALLGTAYGQDTETPKPQNGSPLKVDKKIPVTGSEKLDFIFTRSVLVGRVPNVAYELGRSGTYSLGIGYGFPLGKSLEFKLEPRVTWHKLYFAPTPDKWFPSNDSSATLIYEKQRVSYVEVPALIKFKLARNVQEHYKLLVEMGFVFGHKIGSTSKTRRMSGVDSNNNLVGPKITTKVHRIDDLNPFRFGPMFRIGTNWISAYGFYRLSDVFLPYRKLSIENLPDRAYPKFGRIELGLTIAI
ncbi:MAG: hypothetical protein U0176_26680 [Bacteroidia bacterium]